MPVLLPRRAFIAAVNERIARLGENRPEGHLDNFLAGLRWVRERIEQFPQGGAIVRQDTRHILRMRLFPNPLPYLVYYGYTKIEPIKEIYLVRLYASGQRRSRISLSEWPW